MASISTTTEKPTVKRSFSSWFDTYKYKVKQIQEQALAKANKEIESERRVLEDLAKRYKAGDTLDKLTNPYERSIRKKLERIAKANNIMKSIENEEKTRKLLQKLKSHPLITSVAIDSDGFLSFYTKTLKSGVRNIGRYRIALHPDLRLYVFNLDWQESHHDHWAVSSNRPCLGEYTDIIWDQIYRGELFLFADSMIHFFQMAGDHSAYVRKEYWFQNRIALTKSESSSKKKSSMRIALRSTEQIGSGSDEDDESDEDEF